MTEAQIDLRQSMAQTLDESLKTPDETLIETEQVGKGVFKDDTVELTAWKAKGNFTPEKYVTIMKDFGAEPLTGEIVERFKKVTQCEKLHRLMRRGIFFAHRKLSEILDDHEAGKKIFLYTGRGPTTESLHLGHIIAMEFTVWLQEVFNAVVVFMMADDEKYWFKDREFEEIYRLGFENAKDVIALGFKPEKTFIFSNRDYSREPAYQKVAFDILNVCRVKDIKKIFGIEDVNRAGCLVWPVYQTTAAFSEAYGEIFNGESIRCLVAYAIDQDPYFNLGRDVAPKLGLHKPCSIMCRFLPAIEGDSKMSSTGHDGEVRTVFLTDTPEEVKRKIMKYAFSGGKDSVKEHRELGGNTEVDVSFQWLRYFMEDDGELEKIKAAYESGAMLTGELKMITAKVISEVCVSHQVARERVTDEIVKEYYNASNVKY